MVWVKNRNKTMPASAAGKRGDDDEGVQPRLEVDDDQHVHQNDAKTRPASKPMVRAAHRLVWPRTRDEGAARQRMAVVRHDPLDVPCHRAQIAALHRAVDIHHAADVVVRHDRHLVTAVDARHIAQDFRV